MERPRISLPTGVEKRDSKLFGIVGWYSQPKMGFDCAAFGGYFRYDVEDKMIVDGQLIDSLGSSVIFGRMDESSLGFSKSYSGDPESKIDYIFTKQNGIWVGRYEGAFVKGRTGETQCITTLLDENAFDIICGAPRVHTRF